VPPLDRINELEQSQEARRLQLQDEPSHPSTSARYPRPRPPAIGPPEPPDPARPGEARGNPRQTADRTYESFEWYESFTATLAAGTAFADAGAFSGRPDSILFQSNTAGIDVRFRNRGEAPGSPIRVNVTGTQTVAIAAEVVEARDPAGVGGQVLVVIGRFVHRSALHRISGQLENGASPPATAPA